MNRSFKYRIYPTKAQEAKLLWTLRRCCELYNGALQERRDHYKRFGKNVKSLSVYDQMKELPLLKEVREDFREIDAQVLQVVLKRLDLSFQAFFRRVKANEKPGFPRFKPSSRYDSFKYPQVSNGRGAKIILGGKKVRLSGIGDVKVKLHRPVEGVAKQAIISKDGDGHWYVDFLCDQVPSKTLPPTGKIAGLDLGVSKFLALSDGRFVENPRPFESNARKLAIGQRKLNKKKRGSNRRKKAIIAVRKIHAKTSRQRRDFHFKTASDLIREFDEIYVENLNIKGLSASRLARQINDAGWGQFIQTLIDKAESAGRSVVKVDPRGTSQRCSSCDEVVKKSLSVRTHTCPRCGLVMDRDVNAAINVKRLGLSLRREQSEVRTLNDPRIHEIV